MRHDKTYGSLGGVMMILFWFWVSSTVLLFAAQLNQVIEDALEPRPERGAADDAGSARLSW